LIKKGELPESSPTGLNIERRSIYIKRNYKNNVPKKGEIK